MTRGTMGLWIRGMRPRTLPASVAPVIVGACCAWMLDLRDVCDASRPLLERCVAPAVSDQNPMTTAGTPRFWLIAILCAVVAVGMQVAVNFANDYSDGIRGTDDGRGAAESATGSPQRLVASGLVPPRHVLAAAGIAAAVACVAGVGVAAVSGRWWLIVVGALCLPAGWCYTGGRHPYGYRGLGEVFVFVFFGLVATLGTQAALVGRIDAAGMIGAVGVGLESVTLLMVNNLRDLDADREHGKRTLAVRLGECGARRALAVCTLAGAVCAYATAALTRPAAVSSCYVMLVFATCVWGHVRYHDWRRALTFAGFQPLLFAAVTLVCAW
ncbi:1,4-dihydroxy-2-naphthoate octaprenyltransferase [Bifidobacterium samirii]|nr:1,4-dihydroxy-2-naphthoate octaprenyltransferase [Bifidobacterium samirii]